MIGVKGTRQPEAEEAVAGERYAFADPQGLSRIPLLVGLLITGIAAYLKLALTPARAAPSPEAPDALPAEPEQAFGISLPPAAKLDNLADYRDKAEAANLAPSLEPLPQNSVGHHVGNVIEFPRPRFQLIDSPVIAFEVAPVPVAGLPAAPAARPASSSGEVPAGDVGEPITPPIDGDDPEPAAPPSAGKRNRAPEAAGSVRLNDAMAGTAVLIGLSELLTNVSDADGDKLDIKNVRVSAGSIGRDGDAWVYSSHAQFPSSEVVITYDVSDGTGIVTQTAVLKLNRGGAVWGTEQADQMVGMDWADNIEALGGNDLIDARAGDDTIFGGAGDDRIVAGPGHDLVFAGFGNDIVFGGAGNDLLAGGAGDDRLFGDQGDDTLLGEAGNDHLFGGTGDDFVAGGEGNDSLVGDSGSDTLSGGDGADLLFDGEGSDKLLGDTGDDVVIVAADASKDAFDGGAGTDTLDLSVATLAVTVDLAAESASGEEIGDNTVTSVEVVIGGAGDDSITGAAVAELLFGGAGNDTVAGGGGDDEIHDGLGSDTVSGDGGDDRVVVAHDGESDHFEGGADTDTLDLSSTTLDVTVDLATGTITGVEIGNDTVSGFETVLGGAGNDIFHVGDEAVTLAGGAGEDTFSFGVPLAQVMDRPQVIHDILDFLVGDRILVAEYEFSTIGRHGEEDRFEYYFQQGQGDAAGENDLQLRISYEIEGDDRFTMLEFDYDGNHDFELVVAVHGQHQPYLYEHAVI